MITTYTIKENFWKALNWKMLGKFDKFQSEFLSGNIEHETEKAMLVTLYFGNKFGWNGHAQVWIPKSCVEKN